MKLYCARAQNEVFWRRYFLCGAFFKTKDIVILRSSFKKRTTRKRARQKLHFVPARSIVIIPLILLFFCPTLFAMNPNDKPSKATIYSSKAGCMACHQAEILPEKPIKKKSYKKKHVRQQNL